MKITSRDNQKLKTVRKIRDGGVPEYVFVEGLRLATEALRSGLLIKEAFFSEKFLSDPRSAAILTELKSAQTGLFEIPEKIFKTITATKNPQAIILIAQKPDTGKQILQTVLDQNKSSYPLLILLQKINNPSNLGAVFRSAEAAGVNGIILTKNSTDAFSPKALRGSMGSCLRVPVWENADFFEARQWALDNNLETVCADIDGRINYLDLDWKKPRLLVFGSEAHGLDPEQKKTIPESIYIPLENDVESLNLAVSCGIILFEAKRMQQAE